MESYYDGTNQSARPYGFLRITVTADSVIGEYFTIPCDSTGNVVGPLGLSDSFTLNLATHLLAM
jgi:hypothetical protein